VSHYKLTAFADDLWLWRPELSPLLDPVLAGIGDMLRPV
jgi:hypothetical protein